MHSNFMHLDPADLLHCLRKVEEIEEQFRLQNIGADDPRRDVGSLIFTVGNYLGCKIQVLTLDAPKTSAKGAYVRTGEKTADILLSHDLNDCWRRFVACKELFHVVLDLPQYRDMNLCGLIEEVTTAFPDDESSPGKPTVCEFLAELAAMQFLFPMERRRQILESGAPVNSFEVATRFKVPKHHVEKSLSKNFMENIQKGIDRLKAEG